MRWDYQAANHMVRVYKMLDVWYIEYADGHSRGHFYSAEDAIAWYCGIDMPENYDELHRVFQGTRLLVYEDGRWV